ncbi:MAG: BREX-1 system adenine-specific DNA-methyltransferase PglX [Anaerolineales bacterium]|nr:BREX-1 system adenine-specific DNA-methyltransferase PglX [Anaerolineales bacterium]
MANNTGDLKRFAQAARRQLREQVAGRLEQVLRTDSAELREKEAAVKELRQQIAQTSKKAVIDRVAYTWFNRFCALRFMDANHYNRIRVVSPAVGFTQPEILQEAKQGYIDENMNRFVNRQVVFDLLGDKMPSKDPQQEAYRLLLVAACNFLNDLMPFMFEKITDYTELLMPLDLLSDNSILHGLRAAMTPEACQDVEIIGWLYQYYISERKDEVFEALKQNKKIEAEDIPAATQLFTPHWIVRYLLENSLGRLWMLNKPNSRLVEKMEYYIQPAQVETDFLKIASPEEIRLCDTACGSGHMLTYAFDLFYAIYEEEGYNVSDIPRLILEKNLYGIEIDERAGALAAFALFMKARGKDARFFSHPVQPNICVLENITFTDQELNEYMNAVGRDLFSEPLRETLKQFEQADNFGSLIQPILTDAAYMRQVLEAKNLGSNLFLFGIHERVLKALRQAEYLSPHYHVVVTNPPYMGDIGMNEDLKDHLAVFFTEVKSDLFSAFIIRNIELTLPKGQLGFMSPFVWMFISSYEKLRKFIIEHKTITSLIQLEYSGFGGAVVPICTFTLENAFHPQFDGGYIRLSDFRGAELQSPKTLEAIRNPDCGWFYRTSAFNFKRIPGSPIAYWASNGIVSIFASQPSIGNYIELKAGLSTGDNTIFEKEWYEVEYNNIGFSTKDISETVENGISWYPCHSGGNFRKWYGNHSTIVYWYKNGEKIRNFGSDTGRIRSAVRNEAYYFKPGITWTKISSGILSMRFRPEGFIFDDTGRCGFTDPENRFFVLGLLCSKLSIEFLRILSPTLSFASGEIAKVPFIKIDNPKIQENVNKCIAIAKSDWNFYETSWDFTTLPLLVTNHRNQNLSQAFNALHASWIQMTLEMQLLEKENNRIFIESYGLLDELTPEVSLEGITLTCNSYYRYGNKKSQSELESRLLTDTMKEFINYAVGCMFGRYSLDKPGLILANQGETVQDYLRQIPEPTFTPDEDNTIPILDGDWFSDDISERFKKFLRVTFGEEHYDENLAFIEEAIGRDIRSYFLKEFYTYHIKMYKKRPIYWLFSSPKGSFNVLISMHRYNKDTVSVILNRYLRELRGKLEARKSYLEHISISASASAREKTSALKEIEKLNQTLEELRVYERNVLFPLAAQRIEIDLDEGVKVNYAKFGKALAKIPGLD